MASSIDLINYTSPDGSAIQVQPQGWKMDYPSGTWHQEKVLEWINEGNTIAEYTPDLSAIKIEKLAEAKAKYITASSAEVSAFSMSWNGGHESAQKLNNKVQLLEFNNASSGTIFDTNNEPRKLAIAMIKEIAMSILSSAEVAFEKYQEQKLQIAKCNDVTCINDIII